MRQLDPRIAEERKRKVLHWVVHNYIKTSRPIASSIIAGEAGMDLSSATIRNILKELEDEGFLHQPHTSSGRVPTDRGYRIYVDFLRDAQRLASEEKASIEKEYENRLEELDNLLAQTSKLLSHVTHKAGFALSPRLESQALRRVELIPLGPQQLLVVIVTETGQVRHWPIRLGSTPAANRLTALNRFLNEHIRGKSVEDLRSEISARLEKAGLELRDLHALADQVLLEVRGALEPESLYLEGAVSLIEGAGEFGDFDEVQSMMRVVEDRRAVARLLEDEFRRQAAPEASGKSIIRVSIGAENIAPEFRNLSLVTSAYRMRDRVVGVLGILGPKRMEYDRMMSLVDYVGHMVNRTLEAWEPEPVHPAQGRRRRKP